MSGPYDDIINLSYPFPSKRPPMDMQERAAQFSPFAALSGHEAAIRETARLTEPRIELDEDTKNALDLKFQALAGRLAEEPQVSLTYFKPDPFKEGGSYETVTGRLKKIDNYRRVVVLAGGSTVPIADIVEIESGLLPPL